MKTHAILLTAPTPAAIAVILLAGPEARGIVSSLSPVAENAGAGAAVHAILRHEGRVLDDAMILCLAETRFELHLHGGRAVIKSVMLALAALGAQPMELDDPAALRLVWPDESMISREALAGLSQALTKTAVMLLAGQRAGGGDGLEQWARKTQTLLNTAPLWQIQSAIQWILIRSQELAFAISPPRVAIIGPPNAGKSTLANALLGRPVSITSDTPGTTRDWVDATAMFTAGETQIAVTLIDTAGVRETNDPIEMESIARSHAQAAAADLVLVVVDSTSFGDLGWLADVAARSRRVVIALNKCDLAGSECDKLFVPTGRNPWAWVRISALEHFNLEALMLAALQKLGIADMSDCEIFCFTPRQRAILQSAATGDAANAQRCLRALLEGNDDP